MAESSASSPHSRDETLRLARIICGDKTVDGNGQWSALDAIKVAGEFIDLEEQLESYERLLAATDTAWKWIAKEYPVAMEVMPTAIYRAVQDARVPNPATGTQEFIGYYPGESSPASSPRYSCCLQFEGTPHEPGCPSSPASTYPPNYPDSHDPTGPPSMEELLGSSPATTPQRKSAPVLSEGAQDSRNAGPESVAPDPATEPRKEHWNVVYPTD